MLGHILAGLRILGILLSFSFAPTGAESDLYYTYAEAPGEKNQHKNPDFADPDILYQKAPFGPPGQPLREKLRINPEIFYHDGFKLGLGGGLVWQKPLSGRILGLMRTSYVHPSFKDPFASSKLEIWTGEIEARHYYSQRFYASISLGQKKIDPSKSLRDYYRVKGQVLNSENKTYAGIGCAYKLKSSLPVIRSPLVLNASLTSDRDYRLPSRALNGIEKVDFGGALAVGLDFDF